MATSRSGRLERVVLATAVLLLIVAVNMTASRKEGSAVVYRSYSELYQMQEFPRIVGLAKSSANRLDVTFENLDSGQFELGLHSGISVEAAGSTVSIELVPGPTNHELMSAGGDRKIGISTSWDPESSNPVVSNSSVPIASALPYSIDNFTIQLHKAPEEDLLRGKDILQDAGVSADDDAIQKILKLSAYLHEALYPYRGVPSPQMRHLNGLRQFEVAMAGDSQVYCANHAEIFAFLASLAGVPTRLVDVGGEFDGTALAAHAFSESYIEELGQWVYVDLQLNVALVQDESGRYLSGADILMTNYLETYGGLTAYVIESGKVVEMPYSAVAQSVRQFVPGESTLTYLWSTANRFSIAQRLIRLLVRPQPAYSIRHSGSLTKIRLVTTYLALVLVVLFAFLQGMRFLRRRVANE